MYGCIRTYKLSKFCENIPREYALQQNYIEK